jgi:hypothetical protein
LAELALGELPEDLVDLLIGLLVDLLGVLVKHVHRVVDHLGHDARLWVRMRLVPTTGVGARTFIISADMACMVFDSSGSLISELESFMISVDFCSVPVILSVAAHRISEPGRAKREQEGVRTELVLQLHLDRRQLGLRRMQSVLLPPRPDDLPRQYPRVLGLALARELLELALGLGLGLVELAELAVEAAGLLLELSLPGLDALLGGGTVEEALDGLHDDDGRGREDWAGACGARGQR